MEIYLVGGAVRDQLLGLPVKERDFVVVGASIDEMLGKGYRLIGREFPVFLHPKTKEEYSLARTERKISVGYKGFSIYASPKITLEEDLKRRDLTINAIAQTLDGKIIDPYRGQEDLKNKILRHISPAFVEDPVRILRVARFMSRFAQYGFTVASETFLLMQSMVQKGEVAALLAERVWQEWQIALTEASPEEFIQLLRQCGALAILFPEIDALFGVPNAVEWHPEIDTGIHTLMVLKQAARLSLNPIVRFAALLHDLGKGVTPKAVWPKHPGHEIKGVELIKQLCQRYRLPTNYRELAMIMSEFHTHCHRVFELKPVTLLKTLEKIDAFRRPQRFQQFLIACEADFRGRLHFENKDYPQRHYFQAIFEQAKQVDVRSLINLGLTRTQLKKAIYQARVENIRESRLFKKKKL